MNQLLTEKEVRAFFKVGDKDFVTKLVQRELLPRIPIGRRTYRYQMEDVEDLWRRVKEDGILLIE